MREDDFVAFSEIMRDLCTAFNRPATDDVVRVFFDALKDQHIGQIRNRAKVHAASSKKFPTPGMLRPERVEPKAQRVVAGPTIQERLCAHIAKHYAPIAGKTSDWQYSGPATYLYRKVRVKWIDSLQKEHDEEVPQCVGVVIPACPDGKHPGYRITVEDMEMAAAA